MLKNIKSLFIVEEETAKKAPEKAEVKKEIVPKQSPAVQQAASAEPGKVTEKFMEVLFSAMEKGNPAGFDYLEYRQSLQSLAKMPMDEPTRYQSAFAMAQTMGATLPALVESATGYLKLLQVEEQKFEAALAKQQDQQIGQKHQEIAQIEKDVQIKAETIKKLTEEIHALQQKSEALKQEIQRASAKVDSTKNDFVASYQSLIAQIQRDMENMKMHLK